MSLPVDRPTWCADGLSIASALPPFADDFRLLSCRLLPGHRSAVLPEELARSLRDWLTWWLRDDGETPPADPDRIRLAIDRERKSLRERSGEDVSEDFRAGLAWAENALQAIAREAKP